MGTLADTGRRADWPPQSRQRADGPPPALPATCVYPSNGCRRLPVGMTSGPMTTKDYLELTIQSLIAFGTILVAVLAVWGERFRSWLAAPRLEIKLRDIRGELTKFQTGASVRYYHIRVYNQRSWASARNVRVLLRSLSKPAADGRFLQDTQITDLQLTWRYPQLGPMYRIVGQEELCDFGCVTKDAFQLSTYVIPNNFTGVLAQPGTLRAEILAIADNGQSRPLHLEVSWDGQWVDGEAEMARHLIIRDVSVDD